MMNHSSPEGSGLFCDENLLSKLGGSIEKHCVWPVLAWVVSNVA